MKNDLPPLIWVASRIVLQHTELAVLATHCIQHAVTLHAGVPAHHGNVYCTHSSSHELKLANAVHNRPCLHGMHCPERLQHALVLFTLRPRGWPAFFSCCNRFVLTYRLLKLALPSLIRQAKIMPSPSNLRVSGRLSAARQDPVGDKISPAHSTTLEYCLSLHVIVS